MILKDADLFAIGNWNNHVFTAADLDAIVSSFAALSLAGRVPLKQGHFGPDARREPESQFALGWVKSLRREGDRLLGDLEVSDRVHNLIKDGHLKFVSVELLRDVQADTRRIPWVLDAVALLGTDQPAVGILKDLASSLVVAEHTRLQYSARMHFSRGDDAASRLVAMEREFIDTEFNHAISAGRIQPHVRSQFERRYGEKATLAEAREWIATSPKPPRSQGEGRGRSGSETASFANAGTELTQRAYAFVDQRELEGRPVSFDEAIRVVMARDPQLARTWFDDNDRTA